MDANCNACSQIVAVTSVSPAKLTERKRVCQLIINDNENEDNSIYTRAIQGCYHIVLCYEKQIVENNDWSLTCGIVESLARALLEYPIIAGRLRRREDDDDDTRLEIVSNDCGIRLLEAEYPTTLSEFLELNKKEHHEAELVFWKEIDGQCPQFSPLFYVQVTSFICGGNSIGISWSLLLCEVSVVEDFLKKWAKIYIISQKEKIDRPTFNHRRLENLKTLPSEELVSRTQSKLEIQNMIFSIIANDVIFNKKLWRELAILCIEDAKQKLGKKMDSSFTLVAKESSDVIKIESCTSRYSMQGSSLKDQIICATMNNVGVCDIIFHEKNK